MGPHFRSSIFGPGRAVCADSSDVFLRSAATLTLLSSEINHCPSRAFLSGRETHLAWGCVAILERHHAFPRYCLTYLATTTVNEGLSWRQFGAEGFTRRRLHVLFSVPGNGRQRWLHSTRGMWKIGKHLQPPGLADLRTQGVSVYGEELKRLGSTDRSPAKITYQVFCHDNQRQFRRCFIALILRPSDSGQLRSRFLAPTIDAKTSPETA